MRQTRIFAQLLFLISLAGCAFADAGKRKSPEAQVEHPKKSAAGPRRAAPQNVERRPSLPSLPAATVRRSPAPFPVPPSPVKPEAPFPVTTCDAGGCWNANGSRYQGGAGNTYLDSNGKLCQRNGAWMQCS
jgi:hypothetical protein